MLVECRRCGAKYDLSPSNGVCPECGASDYELCTPKQLHVYLDYDTYRKLWEITKRRFPRPGKKLATIVREALRQYVEREFGG